MRTHKEIIPERLRDGTASLQSPTAGMAKTGRDTTLYFWCAICDAQQELLNWSIRALQTTTSPLRLMQASDQVRLALAEISGESADNAARLLAQSLAQMAKTMTAELQAFLRITVAVGLNLHTRLVRVWLDFWDQLGGDPQHLPETNGTFFTTNDPVARSRKRGRAAVRAFYQMTRTHKPKGKL